MANPYTAVGIGEGLVNLSRELQPDARAEREAKRAEAKLRKTQAEANLQLAPLMQQNTESQLAAQLRNTQAQLMRDKNFSAFQMYEQTKDTKYLNLFLDEARKQGSPFGLGSKLLRVDAIEKSPETDRLLKQAGFNNPQSFYSNPDKHNYVIATLPSGQKNLMDLDVVYGATGFTKLMTEQQLNELNTRAKVKALQKAGVPLEQMTNIERIALAISEETGVPYSQALQDAMKQQRSNASSALEREAQRVQEENPGMSWADAITEAKQRLQTSRGSELERRVAELKQQNPGMSDDAAYAQAKKDLGKEPGKVRELQAADDVRAKLDNTAGGDFFKADMSKPEERRRFGPLITELEKLTGKELSNDDKRVARQYRDLIGLGQQAGTELTDEETGLLDSMMKNFKKYMTDNVQVEGTAAYETFRNTLRHALYGASLTATETKAFNNAVGSLGQQAGPVLQQLKTQMQSIKRQLQSIYDMNDEQIAYYYLGADLDSIDAAIEQIDERIDEFKPQTITIRPTETTRKERPSLDDIYKGIN